MAGSEVAPVLTASLRELEANFRPPVFRHADDCLSAIREVSSDTSEKHTVWICMHSGLFQVRSSIGAEEIFGVRNHAQAWQLNDRSLAKGCGRPGVVSDTTSLTTSQSHHPQSLRTRSHNVQRLQDQHSSFCGSLQSMGLFQGRLAPLQVV